MYGLACGSLGGPRTSNRASAEFMSREGTISLVAGLSDGVSMVLGVWSWLSVKVDAGNSAHVCLC